jgi:hypothetical protein
MCIIPVISSFLVGGPALQPEVVGPYPVRGVWFPSRLPLDGTDCIQNFWAITGGPWYLGYFILTVAPKPSVEWAIIKNILSTSGRIGAHMLLWALLWDSAARSWC